ncbi:hypothetical protein WDW89_23100 [Deltaproteobacteria bacterium TL4]
MKAENLFCYFRENTTLTVLVEFRAAQIMEQIAEVQRGVQAAKLLNQGSATEKMVESLQRDERLLYFNDRPSITRTGINQRILE